MTTRQCNRCQEVKPLTEYSRRLSGHQYHCRPCNRAYLKTYHEHNPQEYLAPSTLRLTRRLHRLFRRAADPVAFAVRAYLWALCSETKEAQQWFGYYGSSDEIIGLAEDAEALHQLQQDPAWDFLRTRGDPSAARQWSRNLRQLIGHGIWRPF